MKKIAQISIVFLFVFSSCERENSCSGNLVFRVYPNISNEELELNQKIYTNQAGNVYEITKLKYLLSNFIIKNDSSEIISEDAHYFDIQKEGMPHYVNIEEELSTGDYQLTSFVFGLDSSKNISNQYINEPFHLNFTWPDILGGGYHYMQMEGFYNHTDGSTQSFLTHRGRALDNTTGEPRESFSKIEFQDLFFTIEGGKRTIIELHMDLNQFYENPHMYNFEDYSGIMTDSDAQQILHENEHNVFSLKSIFTEIKD